ncbi:type II toxin-antitoxin system RelE/ParE family toxin [Pseudomonas sp. B329]|uniref:type II toxin-antitoxin system RelE/ParE family toxin n=1 Tax=Pseudomonas sp. B329 TaxID=1553459 RepID=UPI00200433E1|nr:type II toxin-antitoxin system RelE/ParE family toxin [Pseudomonas sp. B329]MCK3864239.1 type II toxin-antitoxin system RelE/ParE family toxin [Pseudomonas sp. B329]
MTTLTIRYTEIAQQSIEDQVEHLAEYHSLDYALHRLDTVIDVLRKKLIFTPLGYPISSQASELGILHYRELNTDGYRVFYEIVEADQAIVVALVLRDKQSVEKALVRHCLLHT